MNERSGKTKKIALNGILGAIAVICLLLAVIMPTSRISLYALSSFFVAVSIIESGARAGWLFYAATSLLAFIIVPDKLGIVPYAIFFGLYGIIKFYIEKLDKIVLEYILKYAFFNICLGIAVWTVKDLFGFTVSSKLPWWLLIIALEIVFFVYDYVYMLFVAYYRDKLRPKLKLI
ncbi:MAG TPA: hypothetical protein VHT96_10750 [Clostridia bacterium]|nr:hypothetical protein [Clostridia bacterium]